MAETCQLYQYNSSKYDYTEGNEAFFAKSFSKSLDKNKVAWLNYHKINDTDNILKLFESLGLESFLLDDVHSEFSRAKVEEFDRYLYFKIKSVLPQKNKTRLVEEKLSFILGEDFVISLQERQSDHFPDVRNRIDNNIGKIKSKEADFLLFKLLDAVVENYFETLEDIVNEVEKLDQIIFTKTMAENNLRNFLRLIELQKRRLTQLRKIVSPLKDVGSQIQHLQITLIKKGNRSYFLKIYESCTWLLEEIDTNKQILEGLTNLCYSINDQKMNQVIKLLTLVSTIFIPLTFIVGVYGMNFKYMPELGMKNAYWIVWGIMILLAIGMLYYFMRKGWFKKDDD